MRNTFKRSDCNIVTVHLPTIKIEFKTFKPLPVSQRNACSVWRLKFQEIFIDYWSLDNLLSLLSLIDDVLMAVPKSFEVNKTWVCVTSDDEMLMVDLRVGTELPKETHG